MSWSETNASPIPLPTIPPDTGPTILDPILVKLNALPDLFASNAFLARAPALAPAANPATPTGAICDIAWVILPIVLASASSSNGLTSSNHFQLLLLY